MKVVQTSKQGPTPCNERRSWWRNMGSLSPIMAGASSNPSRSALCWKRVFQACGRKRKESEQGVDGLIPRPTGSVVAAVSGTDNHRQVRKLVLRT